MSPHSHKIQPLENLISVSRTAKEGGKRVIHCHGVFDLLHPGHISHLEQAKAMGDLLVVTVTADRFVNKGPGRPFFPAEVRAGTLAALACVDFVGINDSARATSLLQSLRPHRYVKGPDYIDSKEDITRGIDEEAIAVRKAGGDIAFTGGETYSSSHLLNKAGYTISPETKEGLSAIRGHVDAAGLRRETEALRSLKVLVVGETIFDEYVYGNRLAPSPHDGVPSFESTSSEIFEGGALAIYRHIQNFCDKAELLPLEDFAPITKTRYIDLSSRRRLFQVCSGMNPSLVPETEGKLARYFQERLSQFDVVVVADYGHGLLTPTLRKLLTQHSPFLSLNVQANSSNFGFHVASRYERADFLCLNEVETRLLLQDKDSAVEALPASLLSRFQVPRGLITRAEKGALAWQQSGGNEEQFSFPCLNQTVVDPLGAGDAVFALTSLFAARRANLEFLSFTGAVAGALAVETKGNSTPLDPVTFVKCALATLA